MNISVQYVPRFNENKGISECQGVIVKQGRLTTFLMICKTASNNRGGLTFHDSICIKAQEFQHTIHELHSCGDNAEMHEVNNRRFFVKMY